MKYKCLCCGKKVAEKKVKFILVENTNDILRRAFEFCQPCYREVDYKVVGFIHQLTKSTK